MATISGRYFLDFDNSGAALIGTTTTDANGDYSFTGLATGTGTDGYVVVFEEPDAAGQTSATPVADGGSDSTTNSDFSSTDGSGNLQVARFDVTSGTTYGDIDMGLTPPPAGTVQGTAAGDAMGVGYTDGEGDAITTGDDTIDGSAGDDTIDGGDGNDTLNDGDITNNDRIDLSAYYDNLGELHADQADDGILNQSIGDFTNNDALPGTLTFTGATPDSSFFTAENTGLGAELTGHAFSYTFIGEDINDFAGHSVSSAGDIDGGGLDDLLIGAQGDDDGGTNSGSVYLITAADLAAADAADGSTDGIIDLSHVTHSRPLISSSERKSKTEHHLT